MGGKQFQYQEKIEHKNIEPTIRLFYEYIILNLNNNIEKKDFILLGSQGKKSLSGDIDIGLNIYKFIGNKTFDNKVVRELLKELETKIKDIVYSQKDLVEIYSTFEIDIDEITKLMNFGCLSILFPQFNQDYLFIGKFVQIDIFLGDLDWLEKFQMSGFTEWDMQNDEKLLTRYKQVYRNLLMQQIFRVLPIKEYEKDGEKYVVKYTQDYTGLYLIKKGGKQNKPYKRYKTVDRKKIDIGFLDFWKQFFDDSNLTEYDIQTFENLLSYIKNNPKTKPILNKIIEQFIDLCKSNKLDIPEEVKGQGIGG